MNTFEQLSMDNFVFKTILQRRSIRNFLDKDVDNDRIKVLIQAAQWSPSAWDTQTWRFIVVRDKKIRLSIARAAYDTLMQLTDEEITYEECKSYLGIDAPIQIFVCNDTSEITDPRVKTATPANCHAAIQTILLAAHSIGLGACWQGDPLLAKDKIKKLLNIPQEIDLISSIALGYPAKIPDPKQRKHEPEKIVFFEKM